MQKIAVPTLQTISASETEEDFNLARVLGILWRAKGLIALTTAAMVALCLVYLTQIAVPRYTSSAVVALQNRNEQIVDFDSVVSGLSGDQATINTEVEVIKARGLIGKLVDKLDLTADPEFNVTLRPHNPWSIAGAKRALFGAPPPPSERAIRDKTIDNILDAMAVSNIRQSYVFRIAVTTTDRAKSAEMADQLSRLYIQEQLEVKFAATQQATEWLTGQVTTLKDELEAAENAVKAFVTKTELVSAEALELQNRQLKDFRERLSDTEGQRDLLASRVAMLEAARGTGDAEAMADAVDDASLSAMLPALAGGSAQTRQVFQNRFNVLLERTRYDQSRAAAQVVALQRSSEALELQVAAQSAELLELEQLQREANASRLIYEYFLGRLKETSVQQGIQQADSRVLSEAVIAEGPSSPKSLALLAVAAVVGMMGGAGIAVRREMKASVFRTPEELEQETGLVVIGQVPRVPKIKRRKMLEYIATKPASAFVESVRNLRTSILLSSVDQEPRLIMVTSTVSGEGKTTQSLALAQNLASMGRKVLVVEGDIRRRTFREYFDVASDKGLIAAVTEGKPLEEYVAHNETLGIDLLFGEKTSVNAADFFSSKKFFDFLTRAREAYDFVVIDTPPVMAVPDARVIGQEADAVIYVVHWDDTPRSLVRQGLHAFNTVNVPVTGLVLSQIDAKGLQRYGYEAGYGSYASGYYDN